MNNAWKVIYYEDISGKSEIYDYICSLKQNEQIKALGWISILEEKGPNLPRPYSDLLEDGIHELRIKITGKQIRILYFFCYKEFIILTNKFLKKSDKVPTKEILKAKELRKEFLTRYKDYQQLLEGYNENA